MRELSALSGALIASRICTRHLRRVRGGAQARKTREPHLHAPDAVPRRKPHLGEPQSLNAPKRPISPSHRIPPRARRQNRTSTAQPVCRRDPQLRVAPEESTGHGPLTTRRLAGSRAAAQRSIRVHRRPEIRAPPTPSLFSIARRSPVGMGRRPTGRSSHLEQLPTRRIRWIGVFGLTGGLSAADREMVRGGGGRWARERVSWPWWPRSP
jgi:hypothetical protein